MSSSDCQKQTNLKYAFRNSPPYPANKCKTMKKRGNDGKWYVSEANKNKTYTWRKVSNTKTVKYLTADLKQLTKKYGVTKSGSNAQLAKRLLVMREHVIKNKTDLAIIKQFL